MIGRQIAYLFYNGQSQVEGTGVIIDKFKATDRIFEDNGGEQVLKFVNSHDLYLVMMDSGETVVINPFQVIKIF